MTDLILPPLGIDGAAIVRSFLSGKSPTTLREYAKDLGKFAEFRGAATAGEAAAGFLSLTQGQANAAAHEWRASMLAAKLSPNTIRRRLSALRSMVTLARRLGIVPFTLDVEPVKGGNVRDTAGPSWETYETALAAAPDARSRALLALLGQRGLRASEAASAPYSAFQPGPPPTLRVVRKGGDAVTLTLAPQTAEAIEAWIDERGRGPGSLLGLDYQGVYRLCKKAGFRPHALRHCATGRALDVTNGNVRAVARFTGHKSIETVMKYDDNRTDMAGEVARAVAGSSTTSPPVEPEPLKIEPETRSTESAVVPAPPAPEPTIAERLAAALLGEG